MPSLEFAAKSAEQVCPLLNGMKIPEVVVKDADGCKFDLKAAISAKPAVLVFYRGGW